MSQNLIKEISIRFETDTLTSVSSHTANKLVEIMESDSLEDLIQLLLRNLAAVTGVIPTSSFVGYPLQGKYLPKHTHQELVGSVSVENKHEHINYGKPDGKEIL